MKFRKCHVTNSSSSSFVCDICGRVESGWDMGLGEAEMYECVNGHTFCWNESLVSNKEDLIKLILERSWNEYYDYHNNKIIIAEDKLVTMDEYELINLTSDDNGYYCVPEEFCPICNFIKYSESDLSKYLLKEYGISRDEVFAEVKTFNKRRKKLYDNEYITYVCKKYNLNPIKIVSEWKDKFGTYSKFKEYLK